MSIVDWLKTINEKNRERLRKEGIQTGLQQGYKLGYRDTREGKPMQPPARTTTESIEE